MNHSPLATPSATRAALESHGLSLKKSLGQHFLIDDNIVGRILDLAHLDRSDAILEVGPGIGTLTVAMLPHVACVIAIERDGSLASVLEDVTRPYEQKFALILGDATKVRNEELCGQLGSMPTKFVANLPYQVAATLVLKYFQDIPSLSSATVMVQSEVADRMAANPGSKTYGAYTVKLRILAQVQESFAVSRTSFLPPPRVDSTVIRLKRDPLATDKELLRAATKVANAAFAQRRKTIRNSMSSALSMPPQQLDEAFGIVGIDGGLRAEMFAPETYLKLASHMVDIGLL